MPYSISTSLLRNLNDVFGENDAKRRRIAMDEICTEDVVFYLNPTRMFTAGTTRSSGSWPHLGLSIQTFDIS